MKRTKEQEAILGDLYDVFLHLEITEPHYLDVIKEINQDIYSLFRFDFGTLEELRAYNLGWIGRGYQILAETTEHDRKQ